MERGGERSATAEVEAEVENIFYGQLSNSLSLSLSVAWFSTTRFQLCSMF